VEAPAGESLAGDSDPFASQPDSKAPAATNADPLDGASPLEPALKLESTSEPEDLLNKADPFASEPSTVDPAAEPDAAKPASTDTTADPFGSVAPLRTNSV
jgi:hypothetical protein